MRRKAFSETLTRTIGSVLSGYRFMSICGWFYLLWASDRVEWPMYLADYWFRDRNHCRDSYFKSIGLCHAAEQWEDRNE